MPKAKKQPTSQLSISKFIDDVEKDMVAMRNNIQKSIDKQLSQYDNLFKKTKKQLTTTKNKKKKTKESY